MLQIVPGVMVIFASSLAVFGGVLPDPVTETTLPTPVTSYGMEKMVFASSREAFAQVTV